MTHEEIKELLLYDPNTGLFTWRSSNDEVRMSKHTDGYLVTPRIKGVQYLAHRLAWFYTYASWPKEQIDHIDQIKDNNKIDNLRDVSASINQQNMSKPRSNNKSGFLGVSRWYGGKWPASITVNRKKIHLGVYDCPKKASKVYLAAKQNLHLGAI